MNKSIVISESGVKNEFEVLVYKYANAIDGENNAKSVRNVKSDRNDDAADALLVDESFGRRLKEAVSMMHDFGASATASGGSVTISFVVTSRWAGSEDSLLSLVKRYVLDGMLSDWFNATASSESAIYTNRIVQDRTDIITELYAKGAPQ